MLKKIGLWGLMLGSLMACSQEEVTPLDARDYQAMIATKHKTLGNAIILQGRLLESFRLNDEVLDEDQFREAEEILSGYLEKIGVVKDIEQAELPDESLRSLNKRFADTVYFIRESALAVDEGAYTLEPVLRAEEAWKRARAAYLDFTERLMLLTDQGDLLENSDGQDSKSADELK